MASSPIVVLPKNQSSDILGALASGLCLIHCVATPIIFLAHAGVHEHHHETTPFWWSWLDYFFLLVSFMAIYYSAQKTSIRWMPFAMYFSWALLAVYILIEKFHMLHLSHGLIYIPALGLVFLHLYNRRNCKCEEDEACPPE